MSETKFTPGPWKHTLRNANEIMTTFNGVQIGRIYIDVTTDNESEDAALIAAAPDMYRALEECIDVLMNVDSSQPERNASARKADAILTAARGEQP